MILQHISDTNVCMAAMTTVPFVCCFHEITLFSNHSLPGMQYRGWPEVYQETD